MLPLHHGGPRSRAPSILPPPRARPRPGRGRPPLRRATGALEVPASGPVRLPASAEPPSRHNGRVSANDEVDGIVDAWVRERPDLDFTPLQVFSRMRRLAKQLERARGSAFGRSELETWEFDVLSALRRAGAPYRMSPKQLLQATMVTSGTMTNRIDRLVERDLVERLDDPNDGRGVLVQMTPSGLARVDAAITRLVDAEQELLGALTHAQQERLAQLLRKLSLDFG